MNARSFWMAAVGGIALLLVIWALFMPGVADWLRLAVIVVGMVGLLAVGLVGVIASRTIDRISVTAFQMNWDFRWRDLQNTVWLQATGSGPRLRVRETAPINARKSGNADAQGRFGLVVAPDEVPALTATENPYMVRAQIAAIHSQHWVSGTPLTLRVGNTAATSS